jgi:hypothetical protein
MPKLDFAPPLSDFLYRDSYKIVRGNIQYGFDLGQNDVNGRNCRTLAFVEKDIDWQIWIENWPQPTPCKLVITYKKRAIAAAIHRRVRRLGLRAAHRLGGIHARVGAGCGEDSVRDGCSCEVHSEHSRVVTLLA